MTKWIIGIAFVISLAVLAFFYLHSAQQTSTVATDPALNTNTIELIHAYKDGVHSYAGQLKLPHSCYAVTEETEGDPLDPMNQRILLTVVDNMGKEGFCSKIVTRYPFQVILDAPEFATTTLEVNGNIIPTKLLETTWNNPSGGGYIRPMNKAGI